MIAERSPQVKNAVVKLMELSADEQTRLLYESRQKMEWDNQARERGAVIGVAKNLLGMGMALDQIITATGLTREELEGLRSEND